MKPRPNQNSCVTHYWVVTHQLGNTGLHTAPQDKQVQPLVSDMSHLK